VAEIKGSREIGGSQGESPKVGCSKSRSCEITRSKDSRWIQVKGGPLDQSLITHHAFRGSEVERTSSRLRSREVPKPRHEGTHGRTTRWGPRG
jgi:hypothetical protein